MAHLFYDSPTYPWHLPEATALWKELHNAIIQFTIIDQLRQACGPGIAQFAPSDPAQMWRDMLTNTAVAGRLRQLDVQLRTMPVPHIIAALDNLVAVAGPDLATWMPDDFIFANRVGLRAAVAKLASSKVVKNVLVVRGEPQSGKSWTKHFIAQHALTAGQECSYLCEGMMSTVDEVVDYIFAGLGGRAPKRLTTEAAWYSAIAQAMVIAAQARNRGSWIVMDDLGTDPEGIPRLEPEIRKLFDQLALNMLNPAFAQWFKLVLIDYPDGPLPPRWRQSAIEDRTAATDMRREVLGDYLCQWAQRHSKAMADQDALALADDILQRAVLAAALNDSRSAMQRVHDELDLVLGKL